MYMMQYPGQKHWFGARDATLHAEFVDVQGGSGGEEARGWKTFALRLHALSHLVWTGQGRKAHPTAASRRCQVGFA